MIPLTTRRRSSVSVFQFFSFSGLRFPTSGLRHPRKSSFLLAESASLATRLPKGCLAEPRLSPLVTSRRPAAFTLIELLVVIAIIAILAGLAFPAVQGALNSGKKAQARNDVAQLVAAVKAFQLEYGRLPTSSPPGSDQTNADNASVIAALTGSNSLNPRGVVFFEPKIAKGGKGGLDGGVYKDPWGNPYTFMLDNSYDNKITAFAQTNFTTVIVSSPGGTDATATNNIISNVR
jgi:prepilin-type N-terminal cleavage/methylation domain-containing protein